MRFFITGLPRSRTAWFSAMFTATDDVFCYHDGLNGCKSLEEFKDKLSRRKEPIVGDSDSGLLLVDLDRHFPGCKKVLIRRDPEECKESLDEFLGKEHADTIDACIPFMNIHGALEVDFEDIDSRIDEIYEYCTGRKLDPDIKKLFGNFWIQICEFDFDPETLSQEAL